jgi:hypothetical protein
MSKTQLKKELQQLDKSSIINVVLDLYTAKKEARDYLDFFVDPNIDKRIDDAKTKLAKELLRGQFGRRSKARISQLRHIIKDIESLQPGTEYVADIMVYAIELAYATLRPRHMTATLINGIGRFVSDVVIFLDRNDMLAQMLPRLRKADNDLSPNSPLRHYISDALATVADAPVLNFTKK